MIKKSTILAVLVLISTLALLTISCTPTTTPTTTIPPTTQIPTTQPTTTPTTPSLPSPMPAARGTLELRVTDAPAADNVTSIMVTLSKVEIHRVSAIPVPPTDNTTQGGNTDNTTQAENTDNTTPPEGGQWLTIEIPAAVNTFDLLEIKGIEKTLSTSDMPIGKYTQVRLIVDKIEVALNGGALQPATVPSGELKLVHPFDISATENTTLVFDFDADKSVNVTGSDKITVKPVIKLIVR